MLLVPYDAPASMFREYSSEECDKNEGYPFLWQQISDYTRRAANHRCSDCAYYYLVTGDALTVHHVSKNKADCRRQNLCVMCWPCHLQDHSQAPRRNWAGRKCRHRGCDHVAFNYGLLQRHILGVHERVGMDIYFRGEERHAAIDPIERSDS